MAPLKFLLNQSRIFVGLIYCLISRHSKFLGVSYRATEENSLSKTEEKTKTYRDFRDVAKPGPATRINP
ncbi:hypothetical protein JTE90_006496 [Oedothorax gibbosus]|uniref:Uncharacterized protein n=1 Tax=Oedothorax gibbosus TaxID=931172 RepID=A0AAV6VNR9_9ARAC|nr:hypothetical protein JTE90_006496 [Oedothorax gibbosus]